MIATRLAPRSFWRLTKAPLVVLVFVAIVALVSGPVAAQGHDGGGAKDDDHGKPGLQGDEDDKGDKGHGSVAATGGNNVMVPLLPPSPPPLGNTSSVCTTIASADITVPNGPPGVIVATAKATVKVFHVSGTQDRGILTFSNGSDCGGGGQAAHLSPFQVTTFSAPSTAMGNLFYESTVFVQMSFTPVVGLNHINLNAQMTNGVGTGVTTGFQTNLFDQAGEANIVLEFHAQ